MTPKIFVLFLTDSQFPLFFPLKPTLVEQGLHISRAESSFKMFKLGSQVTRSARASSTQAADLRPQIRLAWARKFEWAARYYYRDIEGVERVVSLLIMETGFVICSFTSRVELERVQIELGLETCSFAALGTRANKCERYQLQQGRIRQWIACMSEVDWTDVELFISCWAHLSNCRGARRDFSLLIFYWTLLIISLN